MNNYFMDELKWAEEMVSSSDLGKKPSQTLMSVAKYYNNQGMGLPEIRLRLEQFILSCDSTTSLTKVSSLLSYIVKGCRKYKPIYIPYIPITKNELEIIHSIGSVQVERLAFTLLCMAKYHNCINDKNDSWVNCSDSDIMRLANINTSVKRQCAMYAKLRELGLIKFSRRVDNTNVRVCFLSSDEEVMQISIIKNLGYTYMSMYSNDFFVCERCGVTEKIRKPQKGRPQKYCQECATTIKIEQSVNSVMRFRTEIAS